MNSIGIIVPTTILNTHYPKGGRFCESNFFKLLIGSQLIIEGRFFICDKQTLIHIFTKMAKHIPSMDINTVNIS